MKIGINALFLIPGEVGGTETCLRQTLPRAARAFPDDEFVVFANAENIRVLALDLRHCDNVSLVDMRVRASSRPARILREQFSLPGILKRAAIDVVWNPGNGALLFTAIPQATTIYDMQFTRFPEDFSGKELRAIKFVVGHALKKSGKILTISEFSRQEIIRASATQFEKIEVVPSAVSEIFGNRLPGDFMAERMMALVHGSEPHILCVANTYPHKSVETAVEAFGEIIAEIPHKLVIVGKPRRGDAAVEAAISALPDPGRVVRLRHVAELDLAALYQGADLFILPSKYEGFGLPILEAMAAGVPVISTHSGAVPEVGGDTIEYAKPGDASAFAAAMRRLLSLPPAARAELAKRAADRAAKFSWDETARRTVEALKQLAAPTVVHAS